MLIILPLHYFILALQDIVVVVIIDDSIVIVMQYDSMN